MRKVDSLGRIVIPKELREKYSLLEGADITFEDIGIGVVVKAAESVCLMCKCKLDNDCKIPLCSKCIDEVMEYNKEIR